MHKYVKFSVLKGKTITKISGLKKYSDSVSIQTSDGCNYRMFHAQQCCENVYIEDVCGDIEDIINTPIIKAEEVTNVDLERPEDSMQGSYTWTFYKIVTAKGYLDIRWFGESNGYYSEEVDLVELN